MKNKISLLILKESWMGGVGVGGGGAQIRTKVTEKIKLM